MRRSAAPHHPPHRESLPAAPHPQPHAQPLRKPLHEAASKRPTHRPSVHRHSPAAAPARSYLPQPASAPQPDHPHHCYPFHTKRRPAPPPDTVSGKTPPPHRRPAPSTPQLEPQTPPRSSDPSRPSLLPSESSSIPSTPFRCPGQTAHQPKLERRDKSPVYLFYASCL